MWRYVAQASRETWGSGGEMLLWDMVKDRENKILNQFLYYTRTKVNLDLPHVTMISKGQIFTPL